MTARELSVKILKDIDHGKHKADVILTRHLDSSTLNTVDKALVMQLTYGVVRQKMTLDFVIQTFYKHDFGKMDTDIKNILRIGIYQMMYLTRIPKWAAVNESVEIAKTVKNQFLGNLVNGILRNVGNNLDTLEFKVKGGSFDDQLALRHSHPVWFVTRWTQRFGFPEVERLLEANNKTPHVSFRINTLKTTPEAFFKTLDEAKVQYEKSKIDETFFTPHNFFDLKPSLDAGLVSVQSESQSMACKLLAVKESDLVLDMCAAPGGKSVALAQQMKNGGKIISLDLYVNKLKLINDLAKKLGVTNIQTVEGDAREFTYQQKFDKILLDAPCSGTGVVAKRVELRWQRTPQDLADLAELQKALLNNAVNNLADGGAIVYSTCSIEAEENEDMATWFLQQHTDFRIQDATEVLPDNVHPFVSAFGAVEVFPHRHGIDGAFAVRFVRK